ncbi:MAG: hypothetical protein ACM3NF_04150 [Gemmatimonadota bacterium]
MATGPVTRHSCGIASSLARAAGGVAASLLAVLSVSAAVTTARGYVALLDGTRDVVVRGAFVPSGVLRLGEVRLVRRGGAVVMQTVLRTRYLGRAVGKIRDKELAAWPPGRAGHDDALRYIAAVLDARDRIREHAARHASGGDRPQAMLIEFILSDAASIVAVLEPEVEDANGHLRVVSKRPIAVVELSRSYVRGDIYEIARDALGLGTNEARDLLERMLPPESRQDAASPPDTRPEGGGR